MKVAIFSCKPYDKQFLNEANEQFHHELVYFEPHLSVVTAKLADGFSAVCVFVNDDLNKEVIRILSDYGVKLIALRAAGFNNVNLAEAKKAGISIVRVPAYSPNGVAEHAVALILALNRRLYRAYNRIRDGNFSIEGLLGFELCGKTVGIMGTGKIGVILTQIMSGFGCKVLVYDIRKNSKCEELGACYVTKEELFSQSDIISLNLPLTKETRYIINEQSLESLMPSNNYIRKGQKSSKSIIMYHLA